MDGFLENVFKKAVNLHNLKNYKDAITLYEKVLKFKPSHKLALINLANIFDQFGNLIKTKYYLEKLFFFESYNPEIIFRLGLIYLRLNDEKNAIIYFDKIIDIDPKFKNLRYNLLNIIHSINILNLKKNHQKIISKIFLFILKHNDVDHSFISRPLISFLFDKDILINELIKREITNSSFFNNLIDQEIFQLFLQKTIITDKQLEQLLTKIRQEFI